MMYNENQYHTLEGNMSRYNNVNCPVCDKKFVEGDDVVVCPVCGAPHHRACYQIEGKCHFEAEHASGKQWEDPKKHTEEAEQSTDPKKCPKCSAPNPPEGIFCQVCGYPMRNNKPEPEQEFNPYGAPPIDITAFTTPYGGLDPEEEIDGVTAKELALFVGENSFYYLPRMKHMKKNNKKASWNWSAFIFHFAYYFNRKMYLTGAIMLALYILSVVPRLVFMYHLFMRNLDVIATGVFDLYSLNPAGLESLMLVSDIASYIYTGIALLSGIFANKLYTDFTFRRIGEVRREIGNFDRNSAEYCNAISAAGRTNRRAAMASFAGVIAAMIVAGMAISILVTQTIM